MLARRMIGASRIIALSGDLDFGDVPRGTSADRTLTITNRGDNPLSIYEITHGNAYFTGSWAGTIQPSQHQDVTITFTAVGTLTWNTTLSVSSNRTSGDDTKPESGTSVV